MKGVQIRNTSKIYMHPIEFYGPGYYRIISPFRALKKEGLNVHLIATLKDQYLEEGSLFVFQRIADVNFLEYWDWIRRKGKAFIFDMDDLLTEIPSTHPDYNFFSPFIPYIKVALRSATLVTTPSKFLKAQLLRYNPNVFHLPNYIDENLWAKNGASKEEIKKEFGLPSDSIVIGWMGGHTHAEDLLLVRDAVKNILSKFRNTYLVLIGYDPGFFTISSERKIFFPFDKFGAYIKPLSLLDIGLAPLKENLFSLCKSNLKILEYGMKKIATIASSIKPYEDTEKEGASIFLASSPQEWEDILGELIENEDLRKRKGEELHQFVVKNYLLQKNIKVFQKIYSHALEIAEKGS